LVKDYNRGAEGGTDARARSGKKQILRYAQEIPCGNDRKKSKGKRRDGGMGFVVSHPVDRKKATGWGTGTSCRFLHPG
jgi:hypothetical protein